MVDTKHTIWLSAWLCLCHQDMEISVNELQTILNRIISKRQCHSSTEDHLKIPSGFGGCALDLTLLFPRWQIKTWRQTDSPKRLVAVWSTSWTYPQSCSSLSPSLYVARQSTTVALYIQTWTPISPTSSLVCLRTPAFTINTTAVGQLDCPHWASVEIWRLTRTLIDLCGFSCMGELL